MNLKRYKRFRRSKLMLFLPLAALLAYACGCPGGDTFGVEVVKDVVYGQGYVSDPAGGYVLRDLHLDVYTASPKAGLKPALLLIHGGYFEEGSKEKEQIVEYARYFASRGFVCFTMNYRLKADEPPAPSFWGIANLTSAAHAAFVDAKAAVRFIRANAETYGVDPNLIAVLGESAGAIAGLTVAVADPDEYLVDDDDFPMPAANNPGVSSQVQACIDLWGGADHLLLEFDKNDPPIMVLHGEDDNQFFTSFDAAERIHYALELYGIPHEFYPIKNEGHGAWDATVDFKGVKALSLDFLEKYLLGASS